MNGASQLHAALHGRLDRISEVLVCIEHHRRSIRERSREKASRVTTSLMTESPSEPIVLAMSASARSGHLPTYSEWPIDLNRLAPER